MPAQTSLNASMESSGGLEEVHDLVAQVPDGVASRPRRASPVGADPPRATEVRAGQLRSGSGRGRPSSTSEQGVEQEQVARSPPASTTPAWASTGSISGVRASASAASARALSTTPERRPSSAACRGPVGRGRGHGQDRPLHRAHHRLAGQRRTRGQGLDQDVGADARLAGRRHALAHARAGAGRGSRPSSPGPP